MSKLRLVLGPPGSGKTHFVLREIVSAAAEDYKQADPRQALKQPPILLIVPEQQALTMEHQLLISLAKSQTKPAGRIAAGRVRVLSLSRLGRLFESACGLKLERPSELARRMLAWRVCGPGPQRDARAEALAEILKEFEHYQVQSGPSDAIQSNKASLQEKAEEIAAQARTCRNEDATQPLIRLAEKLRWLAQVLKDYRAECDSCRLAFEPAHAAIQPDAWSLATQVWQEPWSEARVWVDGFAGFTVSEEQALRVILQCAKEVTATIMIDHRRLGQPLPTDQEDWYYPSRQLFDFWKQAAQASRVPLILDQDLIWLPAPVSGDAPDSSATSVPLPRWPINHPIAHLAWNGLNQTSELEFQNDQMCKSIQVVSCTDERTEVDYCCRRILDWTRLLGYRYSDISIVTRSLEPYAGLLKSRLTDFAIPHFIDRREQLAHHPLVEYLRCQVRLALDQAREQDVYALFKTDLLLLDGIRKEVADRREELDELERFGRWFQLKPRDWNSKQSWPERFGHLKDPGYLKRGFDLNDLEQVRSKAFQMTASLRSFLCAVRDANTLSVGQLLAAILKYSLPASIREELLYWDEHGIGFNLLDNQPLSMAHAYHIRVLQEIKGLFSDIELIGGDLLFDNRSKHDTERNVVTYNHFIRWFEFGLNQLTLGFPPHSQDSVLVTEISRGRHMPVRATIVLGLAEDTWPARAHQTSLLSDWERAIINNDTPLGLTTLIEPERIPSFSQPNSQRIVGPGSHDEASREPFLALVAFTRPSEQLLCLFPNADQNGRERFPSRYFTDLCTIFGVAPDSPDVTRLTDPASIKDEVFSIHDLALHVNSGEQHQALMAVFDEYVDKESQLNRSVAWAQAYAGVPPLRPMPGNDLQGMLEPGEWSTRLWSRSDSDLQKAACRISPSQIETFALCPFKHFASYWLELLAQDEEGFGALQIGLLYHHVLQQAFQALIQQASRSENKHSRTPPLFDWEAFHALSIKVLDQEIDALAETSGRDRLAQVRARGRLLLGHLARQTAQLFDQEPGRFPRYTELDLRRPLAQAPGLSMEIHGQTFEITGFIDRLDIDPAGRAIVVDYKLSGGRFDLWRLISGANLQLCLYLLALRRATAPVADEPVQLQPLRAELHRLEPRMERGTVSFRETTVPSIAGSMKKEHAARLADGTTLLDGLLKESECALASVLDRMTELEISPKPLRSPTKNWSACSGCTFRPLCRFDPVAGDPYRDALRISMKEWQLGLLEAHQGGSA